MKSTVMSREIVRERESTRPDERENPALRVPAIRRMSAARSPRVRDPTLRIAEAIRVEAELVAAAEQAGGSM